MVQIVSNSSRKKIITAVWLVVLGCLFFVPMRTIAINYGNATDFFHQAAQPTGIQTAPVNTVAGTIVSGALRVVGIVFFVLMFYAGYLWMTARGAEDKIARARTTIIAAIIGVAVIVLAAAITNFAISRSLNAGTAGGIIQQ